MKFVAVDLSRITPDDLQFRPQPISSWPTIEIDVDEVKQRTCIASWRHDVQSANQLSDRLSECAWDALHLGFSYLLCDLVSIPQDAKDLPERIIEFSHLYESLHAVIAYTVDPQIKRAWLRHEARMILKSPTKLPYVYHKWKLQVPLIFSLVIRQICSRRLGIHDFNEEKLPLCDDDGSYHLSLADLELFEGHRHTNILTLALDRRHQAFASDVLVVFELNLSHARQSLIEKLSKLRSNSLGVPALVCIWAMIEGLTISVRGCDWDVEQILGFVKATLHKACEESEALVHLNIADEGAEISIHGAIEATIRPQVADLPEMLRFLDQPKNLFVYNRAKRAQATDSLLVAQFLNACVDSIQRAIREKELHEPLPLSPNDPQYELLFDETPGHDK